MKQITFHALTNSLRHVSTLNFITQMAVTLCCSIANAQTDAMPPNGVYVADITSSIQRTVGGKSATVETHIDGKTGNQVVTTTLQGSAPVVQRYPGKSPVLRCIRPLTSEEMARTANATQYTPCPITQHEFNQGAGTMKAVCSASNAAVDWKYTPTDKKDVWMLSYKSKMNSDVSPGSMPANMKDAAATARTIEALAGNNMTEEQRKKFALAQEQLNQANTQAQSATAEQRRMQMSAAMEREIARLPPEKQAAMRAQMAGVNTIQIFANTTERLTLSTAACPAGM
jgi:hypothetical protein